MSNPPDSPSSRSGRRTWIGLTATVLMVVAAGACGGDAGDGKASSNDQPSTTSTTTESTTTTATPRPDADEATKALASAAILQPADFGEGWSEYEPAKPFTPAEDSCAYRENGPEDSVLTGAAMSATVQLGEQPGYVTSRSIVFGSATEAEAWVEIVKGEEWVKCDLAQSQTFQDDAEADVTLRLETRDADNLGTSGFEAFASFVGEDSDGQLVYARSSSVYRLGRTVIVTDKENAGLGDDTAAFGEGAYNALSAAYARVYELEPVQG